MRLAAVDLAPGTFLAIVACAALAGTLAALAAGRDAGCRCPSSYWSSSAGS